MDAQGRVFWENDKRRVQVVQTTTGPQPISADQITNSSFSDGDMTGLGPALPRGENPPAFGAQSLSGDDVPALTDGEETDTSDDSLEPAQRVGPLGARAPTRDEQADSSLADSSIEIIRAGPAVTHLPVSSSSVEIVDPLHTVIEEDEPMRSESGAISVRDEREEQLKAALLAGSPSLAKPPPPPPHSRSLVGSNVPSDGRFSVLGSSHAGSPPLEPADGLPSCGTWAPRSPLDPPVQRRTSTALASLPRLDADAESVSSLDEAAFDFVDQLAKAPADADADEVDEGEAGLGYEGLDDFANLDVPALKDKQLVKVIDKILGFPEGSSSATSEEDLDDIEMLSRSDEDVVLEGDPADGVYEAGMKRRRRGQVNKLLDALRALGVSPKIGDTRAGSFRKYIPDAYKKGPRQVRLAVFAGMIDSDGCYVQWETKHGFKERNFYLSQARYCHERLFYDLDFVGRSLGFRCSNQIKPAHEGTGPDGQSIWCTEALVCRWTGEIDQVPTLLPRKQVPPREEQGDKKIRRFKIERQNVVQSYFGFKVDGNQRFLRHDFLVLHNSGFEVSRYV